MSNGVSTPRTLVDKLYPDERGDWVLWHDGCSNIVCTKGSPLGEVLTDLFGAMREWRDKYIESAPSEIAPLAEKMQERLTVEALEFYQKHPNGIPQPVTLSMLDELLLYRTSPKKQADPSAIAPTWEPCDKNDPRFLKACFVIYDVRYLGTVRSNGDTYDHFVAPAPEFK